MKTDLMFLKDVTLFDSGIYDNNKVYENTTTAINNVVKAGLGLKIHLKMTEDNIIICYKDDDLKRLVHTEDKVKDCTYENMNYITKFPVLKLEELINLTKDIPVIFELDKNNLEYKLRIMDILSTYEGKYAIISNDINTLKWIHKNYKNVLIGYKIDKSNMYLIHFFRKYDFISVDINLYADKVIRKFRENEFVIGHNVKDDETFDLKQHVYDALICDSKLDK